MDHPPGGRFVAGTVAMLFGIDQLSKLWVQSNLRMNSSVEVIPQVFQLSHYANRGAVGGIGWDAPQTIPLLIVGSVALIALTILLYRYYATYAVPSWRMNLFVAFSITPLLSHAFDRMRQGYVVDFLHFPGLPVFNFADVLPDIAIILLAMEAVSQVRWRRQAAAARAMGQGQ